VDFDQPLFKYWETECSNDDTIKTYFSQTSEMIKKPFREKLVKKSLPKRTPWVFVPTLYFAEGVPYVIVNTVSVIFYKRMNISNELIGLTSILYLPWVIKMLWGPMVDMYSTKRAWIVSTQLMMFGALTLLAIGVHLPAFFVTTLLFFVLAAFISATHDIAADGFYMLALDNKQQALFVGVRSTFYRLAMIFGSGLLVVLAGKLEERTADMPLSWSLVIAISGGVFALAFLFHRFYLPYPDADNFGARTTKAPFLEIFRIYFRQKKILAIVSFILVYRLGEAVLIKMAAPFLLDKLDAGGLGLSTATVGYVYGTVGVLGLTTGGLLGGWVLSRYGLRKCIWPMAIILNAPHALYLYMAVAHPPLALVYACVALEQFTYGFGFTAFTVFLMYIAQGEYKTSHFAISTGLMALGMMLPGMVSGVLQSWLGYTGFFIFILCLTIPSLTVLFFIPLDDEQTKIAGQNQ
jgi:PAT family beta-lactamase induction signal transducer AmpG